MSEPRTEARDRAVALGVFADRSTGLDDTRAAMLRDTQSVLVAASMLGDERVIEAAPTLASAVLGDTIAWLRSVN